MKRNKLAMAVGLSLAGFIPCSGIWAQAGAVEELIVTGSPVARTAFDTPLSVSSFDEEDIARLSASSNADLLRNVPGISVEGSGGEVAVNLRVRGLPAAGQYSFTPLNFDGFTSFSYFGLNSSAFDIYHRADIGIERVEFVKGGVSNLFGPGSVAGIINYISARGSDEHRSTMQLEIAEDNRVATNFATSGPLGGDTNKYYALSGYYRYDEGPIDTGLETDGYQLKGNLMHEFSDGSGSFTIFAQAIDDSVQFYLPLPLDADSQEFARGNNGGDVTTIQTNEVDNFVYPTANGFRELRLGDGVEITGGSLGFELDKEMGDGWRMLAKMKYAKYEHWFNLFIPAGGNNVLTAQDFLGSVVLDDRDTPDDSSDDVTLADFESATFTVLETGEELGPNDLVYRTQAWDRDRPASDFTAEWNLSKAFDSGSLTHNITGGLFFSRAQADDFNHRIFYLGEFNDQPRFLSLSVSGDNSETAEIETGTRFYSINGFAGSGSHINTGGAANRLALYLADQIEADRWNLDFGLRIEQFDGEYFSEGSATAALPDNLFDPDIQRLPNLQSDTVGNGRFVRPEVSDTSWALAVAWLYRMNDNLNVYANASRGFFWPQLRGLPGQIAALSNLDDPIGTVEDEFEAETVTQGEVGLKLSTDILEGSIGAFYVALEDRLFVEEREQTDGSFRLFSTFQETEAFGIEASGRLSFNENWFMDANLTWTDHEFTEGGNEGNELARQPNLLAGLGLVFDNDALDASLTYSYRGENFANDDNEVELDALNILRAETGYTFDMGNDEELRLSLSVFNLTDETGLTEGNPRAAAGAAGDFQVGRPVLPRRITFRATYKF